MAGPLAGAAALTQGNRRQFELYMWAAPIGLTATWMAIFFMLNELGRLGPRLARRSWLGFPRYVWLIGGIGLALALIRLVNTVAVFAGIANT
jgi:hypothetical protein